MYSSDLKIRMKLIYVAYTYTYIYSYAYANVTYIKPSKPIIRTVTRKSRFLTQKFVCLKKNEGDKKKYKYMALNK